MERIVEYSNGELTIVWKPEACIHAGICAEIFSEPCHPQEEELIDSDSATTERLISQIEKCPSGALTYRINKK
ncbi:MAG: (4Fe-4S)-binding protein [Dysgonomonas sp.]